MKINNQQVIIPEIEIENIEGELVMYSQVSKKIIVFNKTASLIWNMIKESYDKDVDLSIDYLSDEIIEFYHIPEEKKQQIVKDIQEIIDQFLKENLLVKTK